MNSFSWYNIVVVYKPGKDNDVADGMSWWAYPAGLADDTKFHGSDADLKGYEDWEAQEKARNDALTYGLSISRKSKKKCFSNALGYALVVLEVLQAHRHFYLIIGPTKSGDNTF